MVDTPRKKRPPKEPAKSLTPSLDAYIKETTGISWDEWMQVAEQIDARRETEARKGQP